METASIPQQISKQYGKGYKFELDAITCLSRVILGISEILLIEAEKLDKRIREHGSEH